MSKNKTLFDFFTSSGNANKSTPKTSEKKTNPTSASKCTPKTSAKKKNPTSASKSLKNTTPKSSKQLNGTSKRRSSPPGSSQSSPRNAADEDTNNKENGNTFKRRRIVIASDSDDSEDEYKPEKVSSESEDNISNEPSPLDNDSESAESEGSKPQKKKVVNRKKNVATPKNSKKPANTLKNNKTNLTGFSHVEKSSTDTSVDLVNKDWVHLTLDWLKEGKIRDKKGKLQSDPDYDPKTLFVPEAYKKITTPAMKQWWDMKTNHFDTILFFKVGKFYELYHMDAVTGVKELGLVFMKGDFAHSGFPEISYGRYSDVLVRKGFKVARVEQTETPQMMEERCRHLSRPTKYDKVVTREICQITTKGTRTFSCQDGVPMAASSNYFLAVTEKLVGDSPWGDSEYGVCFVDTSVGKFYIGQFVDDRHCSRLRTLTAHYPPTELLYERDVVSQKTLQMVNSSLSRVKKEAPSSSSAFWNTSKILKFLVDKKFFANENSDDAVEWPETLKEMLDEDDRMHETPKKEYELAIKAFGACVWYLKECLIEDQILTMKLFEKYIPLDVEPASNTNIKSFVKQHMVLDGVTLRNLEILENNSVEIEGTLSDTMDFCSTNFGKRLFRQWLCSPLCNPESIGDRLDAIEDLEKISHIVDEAKPLLRKMPDLERLLNRIHSQGLIRSKDHPDSRAIFYEEETYSKRKIMDFLSTLEGFKSSLELIELFEPFVADFRSSLLKECLSLAGEGGCFPDLKDSIAYYDTAFNHENAKKEGCIIPAKGVDHEYDTAQEELNETEAELEDYLTKQKRIFNCKITYFGTGRNRYQLEIPEHAAKEVGEHYTFQSQKKGYKRFWTEEIKDMLARLTSAEEHRDAALLDIMRRIFSTFDQNYKLWESAVHCLSVIDVLFSLMLYKTSCQVTMCRPEIIAPEENTKAFLDIVDGRHPCLVKCFSGDDYIPNSVFLGPPQPGKEENRNGGTIVLVTGPNMGGKSTLMRQTGLLVIMAQMGSYVPAEKCRLTPVDRVFTRLGANDHITAGESTFFVEASETSCILNHATQESLVLVDELGRGTSTHDGTAIACAVVHYLATQLMCRTLFSTHYHSLVEDFSSYPNVGLGHMACIVEDDDNHPALESITFLYKFIEGACPKSYGFNVAHLAGIPAEIVQRGYQKAQELEKAAKLLRNCRLLLTCTKDNVIERLKAVRISMGKD